MKHLNTLLLLAALLLALMPERATTQRFEIDPLFTDSVKVVCVVRAESGWTEYQPYSFATLPDGYTFDLVEMDEGRLVFDMDGVHYRVMPGSVLFSSDNAPDVVNPLPKKIVRRHSPLAHLFASSAPYLAIVLLVVAGTLLGLLGQRSRALRSVALKALPLCLAAASLLEVAAFIVLGSDMAWWCDDELWGFWGALWRAIPFVVVVLMQYYSIRLYARLLFDGRRTEEGDEPRISLRPVAWAIGLLLPMLVVAMLLFQLAGFTGFVADLLSLLIPVAVSALLIGRGARKNIATFGRSNGILITLFSIVYLLGLIISAVMLAVVIFKIILQIIIMAVLVGLCIFAVNVGAKESPQPQIYRAKDGSQHSTLYGAREQDRKIDARRKD